MATNNSNDFTNPVSVNTGGTGVAATTAYTVQCAGTTSTAPLQSIASVGSAGQLLTSNGAGALPSFQGSVSTTPLVLIQTQNFNSGTTTPLQFTTGITNTYNTYLLLIHNVRNYQPNVGLYLFFSTNGGSSYINSGYTASIQGYGGYSVSGYTNTIPMSDIDTLGGGGNFASTSAYVWLFNLRSGAYASAAGWSMWSSQGLSQGPAYISGQSSAANVNALQLTGGGSTASPAGIVSLFGLVE